MLKDCTEGTEVIDTVSVAGQTTGTKQREQKLKVV